MVAVAPSAFAANGLPEILLAIPCERAYVGPSCGLWFVVSVLIEIRTLTHHQSALPPRSRGLHMLKVADHKAIRTHPDPPLLEPEALDSCMMTSRVFTLDRIESAGNNDDTLAVLRNDKLAIHQRISLPCVTYVVNVSVLI